MITSGFKLRSRPARASPPGRSKFWTARSRVTPSPRRRRVEKYTRFESGGGDDGEVVVVARIARSNFKPSFSSRLEEK